MSLLITSNTTASINTHSNTSEPNPSQTETAHEAKKITPHQRETLILQAINNSDENDTNVRQKEPFPNRHITQRQQLHQEATTTQETNNDTIQPTRQTMENNNAQPELHHEQQKDKDKSKNIAAWKQLFHNARATIPQHHATNTRTNHGIQTTIMPQSGNEAFGDAITPIQQGETFRIYFQNVNGLAAGQGTRKWEDMIQTMIKWQVSICGFAETNTEWHTRKITARTKAKLRHIAGHATMTTSTSNLKFKSIYKPGGTTTIALQNWSGRVNANITDTSGQGRWSGFTLRTHGNDIVIITVYRVAQKSIDQVGYKTTYAQQWLVERINGKESPEPRRQCITDLTKQVLEWQKEKLEIIIMIDANERMGAETDGISALATMCNLTDIHTQHHEGINNIATYARGTKRIDFILTSKAIAEHYTASGLLAFYDGIETDHRGSFVDFDANSLFKDKTPKMHDQAKRQLTSKLPKAVRTYKSELWKRLINHNIPQRSSKLQESSRAIPLPSHFKDDLNTVANAIQLAMLQAEGKCAKSPNAPYSKKLADLNLTVKYWKTVRSGIKTKKDVTKQLGAIRKKMDVASWPKLIRQHSTEKHITLAITEYKESLPNAKEMRQSHLMDTAKAAAQISNKSAENHYKSMANAENARETFRLLRSIIKPEDRSGIRQIDIPSSTRPEQDSSTRTTGEPPMTTLTDPREVEAAIINRNIMHFGQAEGTPFTTKSITDIFGRDGELQATDDLLQGKLPEINHLPDPVQRILKKIANNPCSAQIDTSVTTQEMKTLFKKWKERTSTSPSGCHLGHWHALQAPDGEDNTADDYQDLGDNIMEIHTNIMNAATQSGTPLDRWIPVDSTMLGKSKGKPRIDKLRVIHLYEADYNGFLKTVWPHRAVRHATKNKRLNYAQGGGQKGRQANHIVLQKDMKYLYSRLRKHNFATMDNDAKACYDRIIMLLATIISGHFGVPKQARDLQAKTIRNMQFRIRTALGISTTYYADTKNTPLHGSGQGSGSSAPIWMFISSIIMDCFEDIAKGMIMANITKTQEITQWIDGYVDDTSIFTSITEKHGESVDPSELAAQLQQNTQEWEILLAATGGKLELSKCFYYILSWKFDAEGKPTHMTKEDLEQAGVEISIQETGVEGKTKINHLDCNTAHKTLGLQKTPIGNQDEQLAKLQEKSNDITQAVATASITRLQAKTAWSSMYIPAVAYPMVATHFQEIDLTKLENKALMTFLPKFGYNRHTPRAVVYGPEECGGIGIKHLYVEQSVEQIKAFTQHTRLDSPLGKIMSINLDWVQLIAGIARPIFEDTKTLHHMEGEWFISIREFLHSTECQIKTTPSWLPQLERTQDKCIMDVLSGGTKENAEKINRCRIYLQATTLADIANPEGTNITEFAWGSPNSKNQRESKHDWPRQPRPGPKAWFAWRSALKQHLSADGKTTRLRIPLGPWIVNPRQSRQHWEWYLDARSNTLFNRSHSAITEHKHRKGRSYNARSTTTPRQLPKSAVPVSVAHFAIQTRPQNQKASNNYTTIAATSFEEHIDTLDPWETKLLRSSNSKQHKQLAQAIISQEQITIASDGGESEGYGSFGWIISGHQEYARGRGEAEGAQELMQSFRAEAYGMLAALRFLQQVCTWNNTWPTTNKSITIFSDNLSLIQRISWHKKRIVTTPKNVSAADYDTERAIEATIQFLDSKLITIQAKHVKGHQDRKRKKEDLPKEAQMNIDADTEATIALDTHSCKKEYHPIEYTRAMLYKQGQPVTSKESQTLRRAYLSQDLLQHMQQREQWKSALTADKICWLAHQRSLQKMDATNKTRLHKFIHRWLPTNNKLHDIDPTQTNKCPSCNSIETNDHVTSCACNSRQQIKTKTTKNLTKILEKYHTCPKIKECILTGIKKIWEGDTQPLNNQDLSFQPEGTTKQALDDQNEIGWTNFYRGRIALEWQTAQQEHYHMKFKTRQDTTKWTTAIVTTIWHGFLQLWESRKDDQHGRDLQEKQEKERDILIRRMRNIYDNLERFTYEDNRYFNKKMQYWEQAPNHVIAEWLDMAERVAKRYKQVINLRRERINKEQPLITRFFTGSRAVTTHERNGKTFNRRPPRKPPHGG